ncbi:MAG: 50S ribosomal protein L18 [Nitrososphaeraceae archaeon]|jgi:large subunit ribosomal protein L18
MRYIHTIKRIRQHKTNYRKRAAILVGRHHFITVKVTNQNVLTRLLDPDIKGDKVLATAHSRELVKQGWNGSLNSLPACYLTGILLGKKCLEKNFDSGVLYTGMNPFTSRVAACLKGIVDAGVHVPASEDSFPEQDRLDGNHIADYAKLLQEDKSKYESRFSLLLKNGLKPEDYPAHVQKIKSALMERPSNASTSKEGSKSTVKNSKHQNAETSQTRSKVKSGSKKGE